MDWGAAFRSFRAVTAGLPPPLRLHVLCLPHPLALDISSSSTHRIPPCVRCRWFARRRRPPRPTPRMRQALPSPAARQLLNRVCTSRRGHWDIRQDSGGSFCWRRHRRRLGWKPRQQVTSTNTKH